MLNVQMDRYVRAIGWFWVVGFVDLGWVVYPAGAVQAVWLRG